MLLVKSSALFGLVSPVNSATASSPTRSTRRPRRRSGGARCGAQRPLGRSLHGRRACACRAAAIRSLSMPCWACSGADLGELEAAIRHLDIAHCGAALGHADRDQPRECAVRAGDLERAFEVATRGTRICGSGPGSWRDLRGYAGQSARRFAEAAIEALEHVVAAAPDRLGELEQSRQRAPQREDWEGRCEALPTGRRAQSRWPLRAASTMHALARCRRVDEAEAAFRQMADDFPDDAKPLRELHLMLKLQGRDDEALEASRRRFEREPRRYRAASRHGQPPSALHKMEAAEAAYRRVLETRSRQCDRVSSGSLSSMNSAIGATIWRRLWRKRRSGASAKSR